MQKERIRSSVVHIYGAVFMQKVSRTIHEDDLKRNIIEL